MKTIDIFISPPLHLTIDEEFFKRLEKYKKLKHANKLFVRNFISAEKVGSRLKLKFSTQGEEVNSLLSAAILKVTFDVLKEIEFSKRTIKSTVTTVYELVKENGKRFLKIRNKGD